MSAAPEPLIMAHGADGLTSTPESQVVRLPVFLAIDMDRGTPVTPRLLRFLFCEGIDQLPHRLIGIEPPGTLRRKTVLKDRSDGSRYYAIELHPIDYWRVEFEFKKPNPRTWGPKKSKRGSVCVFGITDAQDSYFSELSAGDRRRIVDAVLSATTH